MKEWAFDRRREIALPNVKKDAINTQGHPNTIAYLANSVFNPWTYLCLD
jgi:hypothetical protein